MLSGRLVYCTLAPYFGILCWCGESCQQVGGICWKQVVDVFFSGVFHPEVVNDKAELDGSFIMFPQSQCNWAFVVSVQFKEFFNWLFAIRPAWDSLYIPFSIST
mmetsp:Transcript_37053/g.52342  ORF Transcript_37053/g.52342 Transcript_37053/m.52342 type:complete len:104 (+) Transcript_37053:767-1078(+)